MGRSCFRAFLLVSALLIVSSSHGLGRKMIEHEEKTTVMLQEIAGKSRELIDQLDYAEAGPNTNPKSGYPFGGSPPPTHD
ncbi:hypothetical protein F0562_005089 [Nyssa sinensis]|uniref:Uncharacterized protein n=1 Tax=Nyssa sinensis TaxID=561372 RepID=A0A5J5AIG6_9ASTE|nr:hypothetical protein F0562_005089 [Nyssa sinensis]